MARAHDLIERHILAFNSGDTAALLADFSPTATWVTGDYTVPEGGLEEFFTSAMQALRPRLELSRVIDGGDIVAAEMTEHWTHEQTAKSAALIAVFDLDSGKITRAKIYREGTADA